MKTICLNMIVKNESRVIQRCLRSVKPFIHHWVIVDTGSTDSTKQLIRSSLKKIPGELYERPWVHFAHNRNEALQLAKGKGDYLLFIDADDELEAHPAFRLPPLEFDFYNIKQESRKDERVTNTVTFLVNNHLSWNWMGPIHETLEQLASREGALLTGLTNLYHHEGERSRDLKRAFHDAKMLERALEEEPENKRNLFFLAISYEAAGEDALAFAVFEKRVSLGGWEEEVFYCLYRMAQIQRKLELDPDIFVQSYWKAFFYRPQRIEPLYWLAHYYFCKGLFSQAYETGKRGLNIPLPRTDLIYLEASLYRFEHLLLFAQSAYLTNRFQEAHQALLVLKATPDLPYEVNLRVEKMEAFLSGAKP